jgi:hypothetical protein
MKILNWLKENKLLVIILFIGAFFRFYKIDFQSVWLDEIHTLNEADPKISISEIYNKLLISEPHPPLYFLLVHFSFKIFGYTTLVLRSLSALIGLLGIFSIYLLGKEIFNKKVGILASILLAINYFHIYYSQDGRMYGLLFLTTTISFYSLIKFIKRSTLKNAIFYAFFSALMIYSHFFALFTLVAQYLILLYFVIKPFETSSKIFLKYSFISGITTLILFIPSFGLLQKTAEIKSIWIQMPTLDVYTQFFKDFFGQSEIVLFFIIMLIIFFFIKLFNEKTIKSFDINPDKEKLTFTFFILIMWITITLILPLIRTYTSLPMLINRYFINIVPAVLIFVAIGLYQIKNKVISNVVLSLVVVFSITDIIVVKKYYKDPCKTQFREATEFILKNNDEKDKIFTSLGWYLPYFLNNDIVRNTIIEKQIDLHVSDMSKDSLNLESFWYFDAHSRPYNPSEATKIFLEQNFVVDKNIDLLDCYVKHFILKSEFKSAFNINKFLPLKRTNGEKITSNFDNYTENNNIIEFSGWAIMDNQDMDDSNIFLFLLKGNTSKLVNIELVQRKDVTEAYNNKFNFDNSGFKATIDKSKLQKGDYQLAIAIESRKNKKNGILLTDKKIIIN